MNLTDVFSCFHSSQVSHGGCFYLITVMYIILIISVANRVFKPNMVCLIVKYY